MATAPTLPPPSPPAPASPFPPGWTLADLLHHLGGIPANRVRLSPAPGFATEADALALARQPERKTCELIDGVLVEKFMGFLEGFVAAELIIELGIFLRGNDLGIVVPADALMRLAPGQLRAPDVAFFEWRHFPNRELPREPVPSLCPDLAVEVLSESNTAAEMERKRREYFAGGCRLVWEVEPELRLVRAYTSPDSFAVVNESGTLDGGAVLPGFALPLAQLFARAGRRANS